MNKTKVILSTNGPLHLIKSSEFLSKFVDIIIIQGWIPGKLDRWLLKYISKIVGRDISKTITKRKPKELDGRNFSVKIPEFYAGVRRFILPFNKRTISIDSAILFGKLSRKYIKNADVFHVRSGSGLGGAIEKARAKRMKIVVDHSIAHPIFMDKQLAPEYEKFNQYFDMGADTPFWKAILADCDKADILLVNSDFVRNTFINNKYPIEKIRVVYLGVREDFQRLKKNYEIEDNCVKLLFTGGWGFRKGGEYILEALRKLDKLNFNYQMTIVGSYNVDTVLMNGKSPKKIQFIGHIPQEDLKTYLEESDVYLFPSLCEGCASSGMEALAAGLPVISTIESGLPIQHLTDGYIINSKNANEIVDAIIKIANDASLRETIGKNAAKKIAQNYTWDHYADNVNTIYNQLLSR